MDYMPEEQERGITIMSACTTCQWNGHTINLIDTPGHVDFTIEVERSLRVLDGAVGVFCGVAGVEPQSETVWRQSEGFGVPKIAFINKMDRMGADFANVLEGMKKNAWAPIPLPLTIPNGEGEAFDGVLDLLAREHLDFDQADQGRTVTRRPWSDAEAAVAEPWRESLLEHLAEADEPLPRPLSGGGIQPGRRARRPAPGHPEPGRDPGVLRLRPAQQRRAARAGCGLRPAALAAGRARARGPRQ